MFGALPFLFAALFKSLQFLNFIDFPQLSELFPGVLVCGVWHAPARSKVSVGAALRVDLAHENSGFCWLCRAGASTEMRCRLQATWTRP